MKKKRPSKSNAKKTCLHCSRDAFSRDVCQGCLRTARIAIESGRETDESLVAKKFLAPRKKAGRLSESGLAKKLAKKAV